MVLLSLFAGFTIALLSMIGEYVVRTLNDGQHRRRRYHVVRAGRPDEPSLPGRRRPALRHDLPPRRCSPATREIAMARPARPEPKVFLSPRAGRRRRRTRARSSPTPAPPSCSARRAPATSRSPRRPTGWPTALGEPQIVVQLRDPVARAVSNWSFSRDHGVERPAARRGAARATSTARCRGTRSASSVSPFAYLERGRYADDLAPLARRGSDRSACSSSRRCSRSPTGSASSTRWLGVDADVRPDAGASRSTPARATRRRARRRAGRRGCATTSRQRRGAGRAARPRAALAPTRLERTH